MELEDAPESGSAGEEQIEIAARNI